MRGFMRLPAGSIPAIDPEPQQSPRYGFHELFGMVFRGL
jgi:hypothetical protein